MITIKPSPTADTRTCDFKNVTKAQLLNSSLEHIRDVGKALAFFSAKLTEAASSHDWDKTAAIDSFHKDFVTGFEVTEWWDRHKMVNRHHLESMAGTPCDVNLIDVLEHIADCVMSSMARGGEWRDINLPDAILQEALTNTVKLLKREVSVIQEKQPGDHF